MCSGIIPFDAGCMGSFLKVINFNYRNQKREAIFACEYTSGLDMTPSSRDLGIARYY